MSPGQKPPPTKRVEVATAYHGVQVIEHYRWLEDGNDPELRITDAGHAAGRLDKLVDQTVDTYAFLFQHLGVDYR
jgi:protease II